MDRTHFLASQAFTQHSSKASDRMAQVDAFYEAHGADLFAHVFRLRRSIRLLVTRFRAAAERKRDLAAVTSNR